MMNKKLKGFSLAELLISLLIISIVLSAAIPTLTRKSSNSREFIWRWSKENNSAYFGVGSNQSAIIGADSIPFPINDQTDNNLGRIINDSEINIDKMHFSNFGDKLVLLKKSVYLDPSSTQSYNMANSHISFYTMENSESATDTDIHYAGRIASSAHDLAFGIGTLQSMDNMDGKNTALGHYSLLANTKGEENTAVGEKALSYNSEGSQNTAVGYKSLFNAGYSADGGKTIKTTENTAVGYLSLGNMISGSQNTGIGSQTLVNANGSNNVAIGYASLTSLNGDYSGNVAIGSNSCDSLTSGKYNICLGYRSGLVNGQGKNTSDNYGLYIGSGEDGPDNDTPIIMGHTQKNGSVDKELSINAKEFYVRPYNGSYPTLQITSVSGNNIADAYGDASRGTIGLFYFNALGGGDTATFSITGKRPDGKTPHNRIILGAYNKATTTDNSIDFSFNERLSFIYPKNTGDTKQEASFCDGDVCINTISPFMNLGINNKLKIQNDANTPLLSLNKSGLTTESSNSYSVFFKGKNGDITLDFSSVPQIKLINNSDHLTMSAENGGNINADNFMIKNDAVYFKYLTGKTVEGGGVLSGDLYNDFKNIYVTLNKLLYNSTSSDARLKNISGDNTAGLKEITALEVKNFTYKDDKEKTPHVGVIAQQLQKIFPDAVSKDENGYLRIRQEDMFYAMVNSIKELLIHIQDLTAKIIGLDKRITELEKQNVQLKKQNAEFEKRLLKLEQAKK